MIQIFYPDCQDFSISIRFPKMVYVLVYLIFQCFNTLFKAINSSLYCTKLFFKFLSMISSMTPNIFSYILSSSFVRKSLIKFHYTFLIWLHYNYNSYCFLLVCTSQNSRSKLHFACLLYILLVAWIIGERQNLDVLLITYLQYHIILLCASSFLRKLYFCIKNIIDFHLDIYSFGIYNISIKSNQRTVHLAHSGSICHLLTFFYNRE